MSAFYREFVGFVGRGFGLGQHGCSVKTLSNLELLPALDERSGEPDAGDRQRAAPVTLTLLICGGALACAGAVAMVVLSWLYVSYGKLPQVTNALYVLKPAVLGIIAAGIIKLGCASIRNAFLAVLLVGAFVLEGAYLSPSCPTMIWWPLTATA